MRPRLRIYLEGALLFSILFLPGYFGQSTISTSRVVIDIAYLQAVVAARLPAAAILAAILWSLPVGTRRKSGWVKPSPWSLFLALPVAGVTLLFARLIAAGSGPEVVFSLNGAARGLLIAAATLIPAAAEELFFRSWLLTRLPEAGWPVPLAGVLSVILFSAGHLWEGPMGILVAVFSSIVYTVWFLLRRNLPAILLAHFLHNFLIILLSSVT